MRPAEGHEGSQAITDALVAGIVVNAMALGDWSSELNGQKHLDAGAVLRSLETVSAAISAGDLSGAERMLMAQAVTLNTLFAILAMNARTARLVDHADRYLRLALKAQNQCRATAETIALMKNPPIFAAQANITAGPQQVNNRLDVSRAGNRQSQPNKLLEAPHGPMDSFPPCKTVEGGAPVATVGAFDRATDARRKGPSSTKRVQRRKTAESAGLVSAAPTVPPGRS